MPFHPLCQGTGPCQNLLTSTNIVNILIYLKCTCRHLGFCIFVMFSTFQDEMQYIFLEKNFIILVFLTVKDAGTDVI